MSENINLSKSEPERMIIHSSRELQICSARCVHSLGNLFRYENQSNNLFGVEDLIKIVNLLRVQRLFYMESVVGNLFRVQNLFNSGICSKSVICCNVPGPRHLSINMFRRCNLFKVGSLESILDQN
ncbi:hypothetical protein ILYODFUR_010591 [Ilyodon furcidens]|uniref:Uncharacterized protein n=1 Tax=Ilyodon furcidens TaxID=33524 RepID=A0ABV0SLC8_9TELE